MSGFQIIKMSLFINGCLLFVGNMKPRPKACISRVERRILGRLSYMFVCLVRPKTNILESVLWRMMI